MIKKIIKTGFKKLGYRIQKIEHELTMEAALKRCWRRGMNIGTVIDVGASDGRWSQVCMDAFPEANYFLIEAQDAHEEALKKFKTMHSKVNYVMAAAGNKEGKIYFDNSRLLGGLASETPFPENCIEVPVTTIDQQIKARKLKGPFLIKLDTHGFEIPILEGASETLKSTELLIIETYNYQLTPDSLKYFQICEYLSQLGFSSIEMVDHALRSYDYSFWQMDTFFIPSSRKEFSYNAFA